MLSWLAILEQTPLSVWIRENPSLLGFPFILYLHTLGLAMLAGISVGLDLWLLAAARKPGEVAIEGLYRVMWVGFGINAASGALLLLAYPAKALTNWVFFAKMLMVVLAMLTLEMQKKDIVSGGAGVGVISARSRALAMTSLALWAGTILAGRMLAYTHSILMAGDGF